MKTYSLEITTTDALPISADDVQLALAGIGDLGPDVDLWEIDSNSFRIETEETINIGFLCRRLEALKDVDRCHARLELAV